MTLLFDKTPNSATPAVHILIIAVGKYPFLDGGDEEDKLSSSGGLGQLKSPVPSAEAFYQWIKGSFVPHKIPIGSVEVLASEGGVFLDDNESSVSVDAPTLSNVRTAARAWAARADQHEDSFTIFYFCGHGVSTGIIHSLLLEDFGKDTDDPFTTGAIDAVQFMDGVRSKQAKSQLFLIDACRIVDHTSFARFGEQRGAPILPAPKNSRLGIVEQACLWATALGSLAYGQPGKASVFMSAMLHAMRGGGAAQDMKDASWVIRPDILKLSIDHIIQRIPEFTDSDIQYATLDRMVKGLAVHQLDGLPSVPVKVSCDPATRNSITAFTCSSGASREIGPDAPWYLDLESDKYIFDAAATDAPTVTKSALVHPPGTIVAFPYQS